MRRPANLAVRSLRAGAIGAAALLSCVVWTLTPSGTAGAAPSGNGPLAVQPGELVVNGGAETSSTAGWTGGITWQSHGVGGYPGSVVVGAQGATGETFNGGSRLFTGTGGSSTATQQIDVGPSGVAIDSGLVSADLSAYLGGYTSQNDRGQLTWAFLDTNGSALQTVVFAYVTPADRGNVSGFVHRTAELLLPVGTRSVLITFDTIRPVAPANDAYLDNVSLTLSAPVPTAAPDSATTPAGLAVSIMPASNDNATSPATVDAASVRLLDGAGNPVTTLSTSSGSYAVDTTTGAVTFTPATGFTGDAGPVSYRVTDSNGQSAESTITITVGPEVDTPMIDAVVALPVALVLGGGLLILRRRRTVTN